jgi:serine/threonine protein kinase
VYITPTDDRNDLAIRPVGRRSGVVIGDTLDGRYRLISEIGQGGMGTVFLAEHVLIQRRVAIKVLHAELATDMQVVERFMNEARAAGTLGHPNIVESTDMGFTRGDVPYIVFEYLQGSLLSDEIYRVGGIPVLRALRIAHQIASALEAAHSASIVHRDLKSDNVFLTDRDDVSDHVKVLDFGISRFLALEAERSRPGQLMGTPEFMAPEQVLTPERVDKRADIYALGVILYEMLAARYPFRADHDPHAVLHQVLHESPPPLAVAGLPPGLQEMILTKLLAKNPDARYQSMTDVSGALDAFRDILRPPGTTRTPLSMPIVRVPEDDAVDQALERMLLPPEPVKRTRGLGLLVLALASGAAGLGMLYVDQQDLTATAASTAPIEAAAKELTSTVRDAVRAAHLRADAVASTPMLRAAIETDAATLRDMAGQDFLFTPKTGEVLEVFQLREPGVQSLLRIPATARAIAPITGNETRIEAAGEQLTVVASAPIATQQATIGGALAIAVPVELGPIKERVAAHAARATLVGFASPITLAGTSSSGAGTPVSIPVVLEGVPGSLAISAVLAPIEGLAAPRFELARLVAWALGAVLFVSYLVVLAIHVRRRNQPRDKTSSPS